jgi:hypothetical protein
MQEEGGERCPNGIGRGVSAMTMRSKLSEERRASDGSQGVVVFLSYIFIKSDDGEGCLYVPCCCFNILKAFKNFRGAETLVGIGFAAIMVPVYRMKGPRLQDEGSPFTGRKVPFYRIRSPFTG